MNYLLKQATINKLAQTRLAVNYVLRQRYMQKEAIGNPLLDKYYDENGNRNWKGFWSGVPAKKPQPVKGPDGTIYGIGDYVINPENTARNKYLVSRDALGNTTFNDALVAAVAGSTVGGTVGGSTGGVPGFFTGAGFGGGLGYIGGAIEGVGRGLWNQRQAARYLEAERAANEYFKQKGNASGNTQTMQAPSTPNKPAPNAPKKLLFNPQSY